MLTNGNEYPKIKNILLTEVTWTLLVLQQRIRMNQTRGGLTGSLGSLLGHHVRNMYE